MTKQRSPKATKLQLELHDHWWVTGPNAAGGYDERGSWRESHFRHSHEGGSEPHKHEHTGPSNYRARKFSKRPTGIQLPILELEEWQKSFDLIGGNPTPKEWGSGGVLPTAERLISTFRMKVRVIDGRRAR